MIKRARENYYCMRGYRCIQIDGVDLKVDPYHNKFWVAAAEGRWEKETFRILSHFSHPDHTYLDMGAWIGPTVLYAAKKFKRVITFEPDPIAYRHLCLNVELNDMQNVTTFCVALADEDGIQRMNSMGNKLGDSNTSLLSSSPDKLGFDVIKLSWSSYLKYSKIGKIDLIKIDIEGGEFQLASTLLPYLQEYKPTVYLSTHAPYLDPAIRKENMQRMIDTFSLYKYCYDENLKPIDPAELTQESGLNKFRSYTFTDQKV